MSPASRSARRARARQRRNQGSDLAGRVAAAIPAIAVAVLMVYVGGLFFAVCLIALGLVCLHELYSLLPRTRPIKLAGFLALIGLVLAAHYGGVRDVLLVCALAVPLAFLLALAVPDVPDLVPPLAVTLLGVYWIGLAFGHATLLRDLPHGGGILADVLVATFAADTAAYFGGRMFGRRPLAPRLSPSKTVEGLLAGMVGAIVGAWFAGLYQDWLKGWQALVIGLAVALAGPLGDLFESAIKRGAGRKDAGRLFGAHGGALDRLDAVIFTVVAGYWVWRALL